MAARPRLGPRGVPRLRDALPQTDPERQRDGDWFRQKCVDVAKPRALLALLPDRAVASRGPRRRDEQARGELTLPQHQPRGGERVGDEDVREVHGRSFVPPRGALRHHAIRDGRGVVVGRF